MAYKENPKTKGSGIICCIPQTGICPHRCEDCFFQSGRSYLEPLSENLPNIPPPSPACHVVVVRMNDGNDSNNQRDLVEKVADRFNDVFFNTSSPTAIGAYPGPVVLTINPGMKTDISWEWLDDIPANLMFVRFRVNTWNLQLAEKAIAYYVARKVPVVLTFMAYFDTAAKIPRDHRHNYTLRKRTLNEYWAIMNDAWLEVMDHLGGSPFVHSCGIEGVPGGSACRHCGNCLREYHATRERIRTAGGAPGQPEAQCKI